MELIGFTGRAGSGKDTAASYFIQRQGYGRYALARPLKQMLSAGLGLDTADYATPEQKEAVIPWLGVSYRHCAQTLGTEWGRDLIDKDLWLKVAQKRLGYLLTHSPGVVVTDVRFENEAKMIRKMGGWIVHVTRPTATALSEQAQAHVSERSLSIGEADWLLVNNSTPEALHRALDTLYQAMRSYA